MLRMPPGFTTNYRAWGRPPMVLPRQNITYNYAPCDHSSSGLSSAGKWALGIGAGIGLLPMILGWFGIGGGGGGRRAAAQEQAAQQAAQQTAEQQATLTNLQTIYSNYNWIIQDGQFMAYDKTTNKCVAAGTSFTQVKEAMEQIAGQDTGRQQVAGFTKAEALEIITNMGLADKITITDDGKIQYTGADGQPVTAELTTANLGKAVQIVKDAGSAVVQDDPVKKFNENTNVTAKNASIAKNGDKYTLTINNADGSKTVYEDLESIEAAYTKLGLNADGTPIQRGGGQGGGKFKYPDLPQGYSWLKAPNGKYQKGTSAEVILADLQKDPGLKDLTLQTLLDANPKAIKNGVVSGVGKLEIPTKISQVQTNGFDKTTKATVRMVFDLKALVATITTPDGTTFRYERSDKTAITPATESESTTQEQLDAQAAFYKEAEAALAQQAREAGWTNLTIAMKDPKSGNFVNPTSGQEITAVTNYDKTKPCTVRYLTADAGEGKTTATAYMPDGSFVSVTVPGNEAEAVLALKNKLKTESWTNVTLAGKKVNHTGGQAERAEVITETSVKENTSSNPHHGNWKIVMSQGFMSWDAWIKAGDGKTYELEFYRNGSGGTEDLDYDEVLVSDNRIISIDNGKVPTFIRDRDSDKVLPLSVENGRIYVINADNTKITLEEFINNTNAKSMKDKNDLKLTEQQKQTLTGLGCYDITELGYGKISCYKNGTLYTGTYYTIYNELT